MENSSRLSKKELGLWGEKMAVQHLLTQGYAIKEHNWRMGHYEIDLIAQKGGIIVFVEVKTREKEDADPVAAVTPRKRARMVASADAYLNIMNLPFEYRFDIVSVVGNPSKFKVEHIPDAFVPPLKKLNYSFKL